MLCLGIGILVVFERSVVGVDCEVMENDACNYDAVGKRLVVCETGSSLKYATRRTSWG